MQCAVYKSQRQFDYYLFVRREDDLRGVPDGLKQMLGVLEKVMDLELDENRTLARADAREVMQQIEAQGYYLQMPPRPEASVSVS